MPRTIDLKSIAAGAMETYGFIPRFPKEVIREVEAILPGGPSAREGVADLRDLLWSSIDNADSMDLDQLEYAERGAGGRIEVKIAIADVDYFVPAGSRTDRHAAHNGMSVYTGVETFPLLPGRLSAGLSSLLPGNDHYAVVISYAVLPGGEVVKGDIFRAIVANKAKLVYEEVASWLDGAGPAPSDFGKVPGLEQQIHLQVEVSRLLNGHRMARGALTLETLEPRAVVEHGIVMNLVVDEKNQARSIIEEFMIAANETMVSRLGKAGFPMLERVVRVPKYWERIVETAARFGGTLPAAPDAAALADFLKIRREADPDGFPDLSLTIVKLIGHGEYVAAAPGDQPIGHFALAVIDYTHSTAPNRRYADIVNQRLIKSALAGQDPPYTADELDDLGAWLTDRDRNSQKVERFVRKAAAAVLLQDRIGEEFDGFVTGITVHGTFVRLVSPPAEGKLVRGRTNLTVGERIRVRLVRTDPYQGHIDFTQR